jgi:glycosyltransferase involved in cell wall biosynthesis
MLATSRKMRVMHRNNTKTKKIRALFLGGFSVPKDGMEGGQVFACRSLIASPLGELVDWKLVDSTQRSLPPPPLVIRAYDAVRRLCQCVFHLLFSGIDVVFVFSNFQLLTVLEKGLVCILGRLARKRVIISFRFHPSLPRRCRWLYRTFVRLVCASCDRIICQSQLAADDLVKLFDVDADRIDVVQNWIDVSRFVIPSSQQKVSVAADVVRIIYVGWLHQKKGVQYLFPAIRLLADQTQNFRLIVCGGGGMLQSVMDQCRELQIESFVDFRGWVKNDEIHHLLNEADIFVLPSLAEGMPNSLLQAMACGLPVVTTRVSSIPAIVRNEVNGILIEPGSADAICGGLKRLIDDPQLRRRMSETNRRQILENHDISAAWPRIASILNVAVEHHS